MKYDIQLVVADAELMGRISSDALNDVLGGRGYNR
jgi:hypothetical protein